LFRKQPDVRLRGYVVWVPMRDAHEKDVGVATRVVPDPRVLHYWDENGLTLRAFQTVLGLPEDAWDVYLLYGPSDRWEGELPPKPDFWMHQLEGAAQLAPFLDPDVFARRTTALLERR
jgi:hypothetical protein